MKTITTVIALRLKTIYWGILQYYVFHDSYSLPFWGTVETVTRIIVTLAWIALFFIVVAILKNIIYRNRNQDD